MNRVVPPASAPAFDAVAECWRPATPEPDSSPSSTVRRRTRRAWLAPIALIALTVVSAACQRSPAVAEATRADYQQRCAVCHGNRGDGGGPEAASLPVSIPDWTAPSWQDTVSDERIHAAIVGGGQAIGKSAVMPPFPDLVDSGRLLDMTALIRSFGQ